MLKAQVFAGGRGKVSCLKKLPSHACSDYLAPNPTTMCNRAALLIRIFALGSMKIYSSRTHSLINIPTDLYLDFDPRHMGSSLSLSFQIFCFMILT